MNERWVCKRCFTSVDGELGACNNCGLGRGSEVPAGEEAVPATRAPTPSRWSGLLRFVWIPIVMVVVAAGFFFSARRGDDGQIVGGGDLQVTELRAGDCFDLKNPDVEAVSDVEAKPCTDPHQFEMFFVGELSQGDFPQESDLDAFIEGECLPAFDDYVSMPYATSDLGIFPLVPTEDGWTAGDRSVQCALFDPGNEGLTASMRNAGR